MNNQLIIIVVLIMFAVIAYLIYSYMNKESFTNFFNSELPMDALKPQSVNYVQNQRRQVTEPVKAVEELPKQEEIIVNSSPNKLFQLEDYMNMINAIFAKLSTNADLSKYNFVEVPPPKMEQHEKYKHDIMMILTEKINKLTNEELLIEEPGAVYYKDTSSNVMMIKYHFTLSNPRRSSSINSLANILIVNDIDIINIHTTDLKMDLTNNGYENIAPNNYHQLSNAVEININDCYPPGLVL